MERFTIVFCAILCVCYVRPNRPLPLITQKTNCVGNSSPKSRICQMDIILSLAARHSRLLNCEQFLVKYFTTWTQSLSAIAFWVHPRQSNYIGGHERARLMLHLFLFHSLLFWCCLTVGLTAMEEIVSCLGIYRMLLPACLHWQFSARENIGWNGLQKMSQIAVMRCGRLTRWWGKWKKNTIEHNHRVYALFILLHDLPGQRQRPELDRPKWPVKNIKHEVNEYCQCVTASSHAFDGCLSSICVSCCRRVYMCRIRKQ